MPRTPLAFCSILLASAACGVPGERSLYGCPTDEVCSPDTPDGLSFAGLLTSDDLWFEGFHPTAVGGRQPVSLYYGGTWSSFRGAYTADTDVAGITATRDGGGLQLVASAPADGLLRINAPDGTLYDRIRVTSAAATRLELRAVGERVEAGRTVAVTAGEAATVVVAMLALDGTRVVDDSLAIETPQRSSWDGARIEPTATPVTVRATTSTGLTANWVVRSATAIDAVVLQAPGRLPLGAWTMVCATARSGPDQLIGARWRFEAAAGDAQLASPPKAYVNCIHVLPQRAGAVPLTVTAGTRTEVLTLDVGAAAATARAFGGDDLGDRARAVLAGVD